MTYALNINIIRSPHKKNFSVADNCGIDDDRLDSTALAILVKRIRKPDSWVMIPKALAKELGKNIDTIRKYLRQLEQYGYLVRRALKDAHGRYAGYHYVLIEEGTGEGFGNETAQAIARNPMVAKKTENFVPGNFRNENLGDIVNIEDSKYRSKQILNLSPTPQKFQYQEEEIDFWLDSPSDTIQPEVAQTKILDFEASNIDWQEPEVTINLGTVLISGEERSSAADYN
jgi:predicted transcriptional regulator